MNAELLGGIAAVVLTGLLTGCTCSGSAPPIPYQDDFARAELGPNWELLGGQWEILAGQLRSPIAKNAALWLKRTLPRDVQVEFDARSMSDAVDLKCEIFGDGQNHASGYILVLGGWTNTISVIARLDEHGRDRKEKRALGFRPEVTYHWLITRQGNSLRWSVDGQPYLQYDDPEPLAGPGHDRFAFNNWEADVRFDNLKIEPL